MSGKSGRGRNRKHGSHGNFSATAREPGISLAADSPVLALFRSVALQLNERHDRHERLVKLSRDVTIESKRVIFLLHSAITQEDSVKVIAEANDRLTKLTNTSIKSIATELVNSPNYLHSRAISPGIQEFIEAKTLLHAIRDGTLPLCSDVQKEFRFAIPAAEETEDSLVTLLPPMDFVLGVADLTGELMRRTINCLSSGDTEECFKSCQLVRDLYTGFLGVHGGVRELGRKLSTVRASVGKVESAVYALRVRGREAPPALLLPREPPQHIAHESDDEGYY